MLNNLQQLKNLKKPVKLYNGKDSSFNLYDFFYDSNILTNNINNIPSNPEICKNIKAIVNNILQPIFNNFGPIKIISAYRSVELSKFLNTNIKSSHSLGQGVDFILLNKRIDNITLLNYIVDRLKFKEIIAEHFPNGWIHITYDSKTFNNRIKLKDASHDYVDISLNEINKLYNYVSTGQF